MTGSTPGTSLAGAALSRRRLLGASALVVGGAVLPACTTDPTGSGAGSAKVTLNHWYHEYGEAGAKDAALGNAAAYTRENPDVAVKMTWVPGDYKTKWQSAVLTPDGPDIYEVNEVTPDMVVQRQVAPLDDVVGPVRGEFNAAALDPLTHGGVAYGVPMIIDVMLLWYRKSALERAGVAPPATLAELIDAARALTRGKSKGLFVGNDGVAGIRGVIPFSTGGQFLRDRTVAYADEKTAAAYAAARRLHTDRSLLLGYPTEWYDPGAFTSGAAAIVWGGLWALPAIRQAIGEDVGVIPWPAAGAGGRPVVLLGGWSQVVNGKSRHVEEAKKYVRWLWIERSDMQQEWSLGYGFHVPPRAGPAKQAIQLRSGLAKTVVDLLDRYGTRNTALWSPEVSKPYDDAVSDILRKGADPARTLASAASLSQAALDRLPRV